MSQHVLLTPDHGTDEDDSCELLSAFHQNDDLLEWAIQPADGIS